MKKRRALIIVLCLLLFFLLPTILGKLLLSQSLSSIHSSTQLSINYDSAKVNTLKGVVMLKNVSITRSLPDFVDVSIPTVDLKIDILTTLSGQTQLKFVRLEGLEGRIISNNVSIPFQFTKVFLHDFSPDHVVEGLLFKSDISGHIWESSIAVSSENLTISSLPILHLNTLLNDPITGFRSGLLSISTVSNWAVEGHHYRTRLQIRLSGHQAEVPSYMTGIEKLLASQLVAYVNRQKSLSFEAPVQLDRSRLNGNSQHDFNYVFQTIGTSMIDTLPSQLANIKGNQHVNSNPLNLSDKHIQSIQKKLQSFLSD